MSGIKLEDGALKAKLGTQGTATITFTQTLRVPEDGKRYPLPAGLGRIPLEPTAGLDLGGMEKRHGAVAPLHQSEAIYIGLNADRPVFIRVFQGEINLATGEKGRPGTPVHTISADGKQDGYVTQPYGAPGGSQPWIDGIKKAGEDTVKQLVAAPLGKGLTIEEQVKGQTTNLQGGLQFEIIPMKEDYFLKHVKPVMDAAPPPMTTRGMARSLSAPTEMGLGAGGNIKQQLVKSNYPAEAWDVGNAQSVSLGLVQAEQWKSITGKEPQHKPLTKEKYANYGIPWFDYYSGQSADNGVTALDKVKTLGEKAKEQGLPVDDSSIAIDSKKVKDLSPSQNSSLPSWGSPLGVSPDDVASPSTHRCPGNTHNKTRGCGK